MTEQAATLGRDRLKAALAIGEFEGVPFTVQSDPLSPGDTYLAARNTGPHLLTVREVSSDLGCVFAVESAYPFDIGECIKVELSYLT